MSAAGSPLENLRARASQLYHGGRLEESANLYRNILEMSPSDFDAIHHLGLVSIQTGPPVPPGPVPAKEIRWNAPG